MKYVVLNEESPDFPPNQPLPRVINGFRLVPKTYTTDNCSFRFVWYILPNCSARTFFFPNLKSAIDFALKYSNNHSDNFWLKRWSTLYSIDYAIKFSLNNLSHFII